VALKKSDLYSSLWKSADELRGGMDASQYKDYVLTLLFVKYVSDKAKGDRDSLIEVPAGGSFDDLIALKGKADIGDQINVAIRKLADANELQGVINNADFNDTAKLGEGKSMQDRLSNLVGIFQDLDFSGSRAEGDDLLGDAYEYLMRHFATESGKSKGQFYTPAEVSRVMAQLLQIRADTPKSTTVYDPTCGSGSLLIKVADAAPNGLSVYGQENDVATWALARMNMILHGNPSAEIQQGNTMADPKFRSGTGLQTFDYLVANPPFSVKTWKNGLENEFGRFDGYPQPPAKNGDFAFLLHMVKSLKSAGRGAVILPHGVLFRGNTEATIRKELVNRGYIKAVIGLPANLFYGTGIPACIVLLDKKDAQSRTGILMVDASKGFEKDGPKNRLRPRDMHKIVDAFAKSSDIPGYSRMVPIAEISDPKNDFNLNIPRYIDASEPEDIQDLRAHLEGGIPNRDLDALEPYWSTFPSLRGQLFEHLREGYSRLSVDKAAIAETVLTSDEYSEFVFQTVKSIGDWWFTHRKSLELIDEDTVPVDVIASLSEDLLELFRSRPLLDPYGIYEQLMSYWNGWMHDDVTLIVGAGWDNAARPRLAIEDKERKLSEAPDMVLGSGRRAAKYKMDLVPPELIVARYFKEDSDLLAELVSDAESSLVTVEEFIEDNSGDEGLLGEAFDGEKINKTSVSARLREARLVDDNADEIAALSELIRLYDVEATSRGAARAAAAALNDRTLAKYGELSTNDVKVLVIQDKWGLTIGQQIAGEAGRRGQRLISRLRTLASRYEFTLDQLDSEVEILGGRVRAHLVSIEEQS
jgi:type I restriction enzyme M protein